MFSKKNQQDIHPKNINERGAVSVLEYSMLIFIVVGVTITMTIYVRRGLQARLRDAREYAIVQAGNECDCYCKKAGGYLNQTLNCELNSSIVLAQSVGIDQQYEPYYSKVNSISSVNSLEAKGTTSAYAAKITNSLSQGDSISEQLPPR